MRYRRPALLEQEKGQGGEPEKGRNGGLGPVWRAANTYLAKASTAIAAAPRAASKPTSNKAKAAAAKAKAEAEAAAAAEAEAEVEAAEAAAAEASPWPRSSGWAAWAWLPSETALSLPLEECGPAGQQAAPRCPPATEPFSASYRATQRHTTPGGQDKGCAAALASPVWVAPARDRSRVERAAGQRGAGGRDVAGDGGELQRLRRQRACRGAWARVTIGEGHRLSLIVGRGHASLLANAGALHSPWDVGTRHNGPILILVTQNLDRGERLSLKTSKEFDACHSKPSRNAGRARR